MPGAFNLVRFRSVPGTAKEICALFLSMGAGLITGMGYLGFAVLFTVVMCLMFLLYNRTDLGAKKNAAIYKTLTVTIPEDLDYTGVFDDIFKIYTSACELVHVKTTNMGSMFRLTYQVTLRDAEKEKEMVDKLRCRNGNLEISVSRPGKHRVRAVARKEGHIYEKMVIFDFELGIDNVLAERLRKNGVGRRREVC